MMGIGMAVRPPRSRGPVLMMIDALRRLGGSLWMVENAFSGAFVDNVGTTPVTAVGDLVGLLTDRSYGVGNLGAELCANGGFDSADGWAGSVAGVAITGGVLAFDGVTSIVAGTTVMSRGLLSAAVAGRSYEVIYTINGGTTGAVSVNVGGTSGTARTAAGIYSEILVATNTTGVAIATRSTTGVRTGSIDNISVREALGNHATQSAVASKPSVQRVPKRTRGPVNQLLWSQWGGGGTAPTGWIAFGAGGVEGALLPSGMRQRVFTSTASRDFIYAAPSVAANTIYTVAVYVHANPNNVNAQNIVWQGAMPVGSGFVVPDTVPAADSFILATLTVGATAGSITLRVGLGASSNTTGTLTLSAPALFQGVYTTQQIIDNGGIPLTTTQPLPNVLEWANVISFADNDFLQTGITTGNEGWVCAGVAHNVAATAIVFSGGGENATQAGAALRMAGGSTGCQLMLSDGVTGQVIQSPVTTVAPGTPFVYEGGWDASTRLVGVNGAITSAAKTINCASSLQSRIGGSVTGGLPFNGPMHAIVYTPVLPDAATRKIIRNGIAALQGRTL